jgi:hypothetical protein
LLEPSAVLEDPVVFTFKVKVVAVAALIAWVAGKLQVVLAGAPAQLRTAVPLIPAPPIESK